MSDVDGTDDDFVRVELDCIKETRSAAAARIQEAARRRLEALTVADARGTALPDGVRTKWIPSGNDGVALEVTVAKKDEENRATQKQHALRVAMINSRKLRIGRHVFQRRCELLAPDLPVGDRLFDDPVELLLGDGVCFRDIEQRA